MAEDERAVTSAESTFAHFSLVGDRFDAPGMPADSAREVGYYRDAVWQFARDIWLTRNPDRRRVPEGFDAAFDLRLTSVEQGSARPQLILRRSPTVSSVDWNEWSEIYAAARDQVTDVVGAIFREEVVPPGVTGRTRASLKRVGSSLGGSERITVGHPTEEARRAELTETTRRILAQIDDTLPPAAQEHELVGVIVEYDGVGLSFKLRTDEGLSTCVLEHFNSELARFARDVLALDGVTAPDVSVVGETLDSSQKNIHLFNVHGITLVRSIEEKTLVARVAELSLLQSGWLGPGSEAPSNDALRRVELMLKPISAAGMSVDLMPAADGSVVIEWRRGETEFTATLLPQGRLVLIADDTQTDGLREAEVPFDVDVLTEFLMRSVLP